LAFKSNVTSGDSFYEIRHNTAGGVSVPAGFYDNNVFIGLTSVYGRAMNPLSVSARADITAAGAVKGATLEATGDARVFGAVRSGNGSSIYVAKKSKSNSATNSASVSFTLSNTAQAGIWRVGYIYLKVAGNDNSLATSPVAWYLYKVQSLGNAYPTLSILKNSGGDTAAFTVTDAGNGVITVSSTEDVMVCNFEYGFSTGNVNIT